MANSPKGKPKPADEGPEAWDPKKISEAVKTSGRPLEVETAEAILSQVPAGFREWELHLGSYFHDEVSEKIRELDVLLIAQANAHVNDNRIQCRMYVPISCKGFLHDVAPVMLTVDQGTVPEFRAPELVHESSLPSKRNDIGKFCSKVLLAYAGQLENRFNQNEPRVVGFELVKRKENGEYWVQGDKPLFEGYDSAIKAALDLRNRDQRAPKHNPLWATLYVPVLVTSRTWWSQPLENRAAATPDEKGWGYMASLYPDPTDGSLRAFLCLLAARPNLKDLGHHLVRLFGKFREAVIELARGGMFEFPIP